MDVNYLLGCGVVWHKIADPEAGWELVEALGSPDPRLRILARVMLVENGDPAMALLEGAVSNGVISPEQAGPCMLELLRAENSAAGPGGANSS